MSSKQNGEEIHFDVEAGLLTRYQKKKKSRPLSDQNSLLTCSNTAQKDEKVANGPSWCMHAVHIAQCMQERRPWLCPPTLVLLWTTGLRPWTAKAAEINGPVS